MSCRNATGLLATLVVQTLVGCSSSEPATVAPTGTPPPLAPAGPRPVLPLASLDERCDETDLTGRAVLDRVAPSYVSTLVFDQDASPPTRVEITLVYDGGPITCRPRWGGLGRDRPEVDTELNVDVRATFTTVDDGTFAESFTATLTTEPGGRPRFRAGIPSRGLRGAYKPRLPNGSEIRLDATC